MKRVHEYDIVSSLKKGDMVVLFNTWWRKLSYFAQGLLGNRPEAEDVATDALIKLYKKKNDFDNATDISAFLYQTVRFDCFSILKHRRIVDRHISHENLHGEDAEDVIQSKIIQTEVIASICQTAEYLPKERKKVFKLLFVDGISPNEAAIKLGISTNTIGVQKKRIIQFFKDSLIKQ